MVMNGLLLLLLFVWVGVLALGAAGSQHSPVVRRGEGKKEGGKVRWSEKEGAVKRTRAKKKAKKVICSLVAISYFKLVDIGVSILL